MKPEIVNGLKELIDSAKIESYMFPVKKGNRINIGSYSVAETKEGYSVKSYKTNTIIAETCTLDAALAIAKSYAKNKTVNIKNILSIDSHLMKHKLDCMFYKHSLKAAKDYQRYEILYTRYQISRDSVQDDKQKLHQFIL